MLLPASIDDWTEDDVDRAIIHELEHIRRHDWLVQLLTRFVCALYWFHPLAWIARRRLVAEAEKACDDAVLSRAEPTVYAEQLLRLARRMSQLPIGQTVAMASRSDLRARISALMDAQQARGPAGPRLRVVTAAAMTALVVGVASVRAVEREATAQGPPSLRADTGDIARLSAQPATGGAGRSGFTSISITRNDGTGLHRGPILEGTTFSWINAQAAWLVQDAYDVRSHEVVEGPAWIRDRSAYFNVTASAPAGTPRDELRAMLRQVLADRFQLLAHTESRSVSGWTLRRVDSGELGPNLQLTTQSCAELRATAGPGIRNPCLWDFQVGRRTGLGVDMEWLAGQLSTELRQPIVDETGLQGVLNVDLTYTPEVLRNHPPDRFKHVDPNGSSIFEAVREQLGLRLDERTGTDLVVVVDRIEPPNLD